MFMNKWVDCTTGRLLNAYSSLCAKRSVLFTIWDAPEQTASARMCSHESVCKLRQETALPLPMKPYLTRMHVPSLPCLLYLIFRCFDQARVGCEAIGGDRLLWPYRVDMAKSDYHYHSFGHSLCPLPHRPGWWWSITRCGEDWTVWIDHRWPSQIAVSERVAECKLAVLGLPAANWLVAML